MTTLSSGVLLKLLDGMKSAAAKPVTDIVPAELDEKNLFPKHGKFYVKVSDASHSIYAALPLAQSDLVLSNKPYVGQFVHVDRLDPASPVPVIVGARPLPGPEQNAAIKPTTLNFDAVRMTPVEDRAGATTTPAARDRGAAATPGRERAVAASPATWADPSVKIRHWPAMSTASVRKSSSMLHRLRRLTRSKSFVADRDRQQHPRIPKSPFPTEKSSVSSATAARVPVPRKLRLLGKDAIEQREQAQKVALEAQRNASATENVARIYKMFSELSRTASLEAPATCFESFLNFHRAAVKGITDIEALQAATSMAAAVARDAPPVLQEIAQNRAVVRRRGVGLGAVSKSVSFAPGMLDPKQDYGGGKVVRSSRASRKCLAMDKIGKDGGDKKRSSSSASSSATTHSPLASSLKLAKQIQTEAGSWFIDFLQAALETSNRCCLQSLMLQVFNLVEMEQSGGGGGDSSGSRTAHPRAAAVARKPRTKAKNPC
ncbi:hypothetical protein BDA96_03G106900 [Sorghum bicolor]|uniref:Uncharacterized protein n=1 Tax=Sorghum bicolor TaxID=4558 RepID=A0A921RBZ9_SORBI|nr:hypothetical protein BDA96_03G106900 [Sorghum bicolor]